MFCAALAQTGTRTNLLDAAAIGRSLRLVRHPLEPERNYLWRKIKALVIIWLYSCNYLV
jgi:hypothetical protein